VEVRRARRKRGKKESNVVCEGTGAGRGNFMCFHKEERDMNDDEGAGSDVSLARGGVSKEKSPLHLSKKGAL